MKSVAVFSESGIRRYLVAMIFCSCSALAQGTQLEFFGDGRGAACSTMTCPHGVNCDVFMKPSCQQCVATAGKKFVIHCADASCSSFGNMMCEDAGPGGNANATPANCVEAKTNADWVLIHNDGARQIYKQARRAGQSPFEALLAAQGHNPSAQLSLRACGGWIAQYAANLEAGVIGGGAGQAPGIPTSCSAPPLGVCAGCQITCPANMVAFCAPGFTWWTSNVANCLTQAKCSCSNPP